jgi:hypothetical protein
LWIYSDAPVSLSDVSMLQGLEETSPAVLEAFANTMGTILKLSVDAAAVAAAAATQARSRDSGGGVGDGAGSEGGLQRKSSSRFGKLAASMGAAVSNNSKDAAKEPLDLPGCLEYLGNLWNKGQPFVT